MTLDQHNSGADRLAHTNTSHNGPVNGLVFTPTGDFLVSSGTDDQIRLWSMADGRNMLVNYGPHLRNHSSHAVYATVSPLHGASPPVVFHPSDDHCILMLNMLEGDLIKKLKGPFSKVTAVVWRAETEELYTSSYDDEILVWAPSAAETEVLKEEVDEDEWSSDGD